MRFVGPLRSVTWIPEFLFALCFVVSGCQPEPADCGLWGLSEDGVCVDINECEVDNGGCGDPDHYLCIDQVAAAPLCDYDPSRDQAELCDGVSSLDITGSYPSVFVVFGQEAFNVVLEEGEPFVAAARHGAGRVVVVGHEGMLGGSGGDGDRLIENAVQWASQNPTPSVGLQSAGSPVAPRLDALGLSYEVTSPLQLSGSGVDLYVTDTYEDYSPEEDLALVDFLAGGGGVLAGGHAWYWGYSNDNAAENYPGNHWLVDAGMVITEDYLYGAVHSVDAGPPDPLYHASDALELMGAHLDGTSELLLEDQVTAVNSVGRAITYLPLSFSAYFDRARGLVASTQAVVPTQDNPVVPAQEPVDHLFVRLETKFATEAPAEDVTAVGAAADFPGSVDADAERVRLTVTIGGTYDGRNSAFAYSGAQTDALRSTGLYAPPGERISITLPESAVDAGLRVLIGGHTDTLWGAEEWSRFPQVTRHDALEAVETETASGFGGLIYIRVPVGSALGEVEVEIGGAVRAPWYRRGVDNNDSWVEGIREYPAPWAELGSDKFKLTLQSAAIRSLDDPEALLDFWDQVLDAQADLSGLDRDRNRAEHIVLDRQISAGWMHSGYPIMAHLESTDELSVASQLQSVGSWGAFHELGHNHQWIDWVLPGTTEANVNLFTLYSFETVVGGDSLAQHSALDPEDRAERIEAYLATGPDFGQWSVWTALETYIQLQEAFGWDFYTDLFVEYRELIEGKRPGDDQERIDSWVKLSSIRAGYNLVPFYEAWGFPISPQVADFLADFPEWTESPML